MKADVKNILGNKPLDIQYTCNKIFFILKINPIRIGIYHIPISDFNLKTMIFSYLKTASITENVPLISLDATSTV